MKKDFAAGGVVSREGKLLLVKVKNLLGEVRWTFPKGHPEQGETPLEAALREVEEETGWRCRKKCSLLTVGYRFKKKGHRYSKRVKWYWMEPVERTGKPDAGEVMAVRWAGAPRAEKLLSYPSDFKLLARWKTASREDGR